MLIYNKKSNIITFMISSSVSGVASIFAIFSSSAASRDKTDSIFVKILLFWLKIFSNAFCDWEELRTCDDETCCDELACAGTCGDETTSAETWERETTFLFFGSNERDAFLLFILFLGKIIKEYHNE